MDSETLGRATEHSGWPVAGEGDVCSARRSTSACIPISSGCSTWQPCLPSPFPRSVIPSDTQALCPTGLGFSTPLLSSSPCRLVSSLPPPTRPPARLHTGALPHLRPHPFTSLPLTCSPCLPVSSPALLTHSLTHSLTQPPTQALSHSTLSLPSLLSPAAHASQ